MKLLRRDEPIDPKVQRELEAIESALAGEPVEPDLEPLAELARAVRDDRAAPPHGLRVDLETRIASGFEPRDAGEGEPSRAVPRIRWPGLRRALPVGGVALTLVVAGGAVVSSGVFDEAGDRTGGTMPSQQQPAASRGGDAKEAPPSSLAAEPGRAGGTEAAPDVVAPPPEPPIGGRNDTARPRRVETSVQLALATAPGDVEDAADEVVRITDRFRGFVTTSSVTGGSSAQPGATFELRLPSARVQEAVAALSGIAHVRERTQGTQDITSSFVEVRSDIADAKRERAALLRQLDDATTPGETSAARERLRANSRELRQYRGALNRLENRVSYSNVSVTIVADASAGDDGKFTVADALEDVRDILGAAAAILLIAIAILLPTLALGAVGLIVARSIRRRSRERALDAQASAHGDDAR
jgi:hypothetical protein